MNLYIYEECSSTNDLASNTLFRHSDTIWAERQWAGRGQRGNKWMSGVGENITFSVVLQPRGVAAAEQFIISQITALALRDTLAQLGIESRVKWTNDIYVGDMKIAGVLIENSLQEGRLSRSIIGIGLNINQELFDPELPNPTSMRVVSGRRYSREGVLRLLHAHLMERYSQIEENRSLIEQHYHEALYRRDEQHTFQLAGGELMQATIEGVGAQGELMLRHSTGERKGYLFREVGFVIETRN
ncbi:MAG: biotin--[acetyl-CoA-carboxylase] ligase [Rikenellaceae bacterium]